MPKNSFRCRNGSGELDVFEAAKYFSCYNEAASYNCATLISQKITRDERQPPKGGRISLDVPMRRNPLLQQSHSSEKRVNNKEQKHKQPSSPGGKLASFLNSLFNQTGSKKKKNSKSCTTQSMKGEEESPGGGRRKRRMSISHFRSDDTKSFYSSSSSGFRTPPPYAAATPTKNYKGSDLLNEKRNENSKFIDGILEKYKNLDTHHRDMNNRNVRVDRYESEEKGFGRKFCEIADGADSDSSSDLFELKSYDLGSYSSGLPVFETTNMDSFKRGAPVSNGAL
ncbi:MADS-box protein 4 [Hibiscus syriacus]|uniref:MADS-box protein 4 n=1 Tax=Hibiscus syriacus TaxID=106335 RepID=A0A6A2X385_HIBSY|nr:protein BIG GRAIN 1-like E [Hibiscus syriacus]KAE8661455.1 MADS-box protein 4 [Hibiscus syriacus]